MEKTITETVRFCDFCKTNRGWYKCLNCGKDLCHACEDKYYTTFFANVWHTTGEDQRYCYECQAICRKDSDQLFFALLHIETLTAERVAYLEAFEHRAKQAAERIKELLAEEH